MDNPKSAPIALTFVSPVEYHATMGGLEFRLKSHDGDAWELGPLGTDSAAADLISHDRDGTGSAWVDFSKLEYALRFLPQAGIY